MSENLIIDFARHLHKDRNEIVDCLHNYGAAQKRAQFSKAEHGLADIKTGTFVQIYIPVGVLVTKSYFMGFISEYAELIHKSDPTRYLSSLVIVSLGNRISGVRPYNSRYEKSVENFQDALRSIERSFDRELRFREKERIKKAGET